VRDDRRLPPGSIRRYEHPLPHRYTIADLERESGLTARTIRYYISQGLMQPAFGRGPSAVYDADHLLRLRYIQRLKEDRVPLDEIKSHLNSLSPEEVAMALKVETQPEAENWRHFRLHGDFEIIVRDRPAGSRDVTHERAFDLIVEYARSVLEDLDGRNHE
jgi:DNA-binding transcriptional MerR regulator